jgi:hypothetical protein
MHLSSGFDTYQIARTPSRSANGGLVVTPNFSASLHRALINTSRRHQSCQKFPHDFTSLGSKQ